MSSCLRAVRIAAISLLPCAFLFAPRVASADEEGRPPVVSVALERVGGVSYSKLSPSEGNGSASLTAFGLGSININPYTAPRLGIDYIAPSGVTLGGGLGFARLSASADGGSSSSDVGPLFLYTFSPRVGYRIPLSSKFDLTPRAGVTLAGGSLSLDNDQSVGVFAVALSAEATGALRLTRSFNLLAGVAFDQTVSATSSATTKTTSSNGNVTTTHTSDQDIKGSLFTGQLWLGIGGYL